MTMRSLNALIVTMGLLASAEPAVAQTPAGQCLVARRGYRGSEGTTQTYSSRRTTNALVTAREVLQAAETDPDNGRELQKAIKEEAFVQLHRSVYLQFGAAWPGG